MPASRTATAAPTALHGVSYGTYVQLRDDPRNDHLRMTYYDGVLEIMSPEFLHDRGADRVGMIVRAVAEVHHLPCCGARSTTFRRGQAPRRRGKGKEPDHSFYFANEPAIRDKDRIDLDVDPPPDLWIEVDNRGSSRGRLPVYAELGVPEVWRYRVRRDMLEFLGLDGAARRYAAIDRSLSLPMLTPERVLVALDQWRGRSESDWGRWLREWAAQLPNP